MSQVGQMRLSFPRPSRALKALMLVLFAVWLMFAIALNWGGAPAEAFLLFCGNTELIFQGQVWRLFTAPFLTQPDSPFAILITLMGFFFFAPSLEEAWGTGRLLRFLALSALIAYGFQMLCQLVLPSAAAARLVPSHWFGAIPVIDAIVIAFALAFPGRTIYLLVLPVSSRLLIAITVIMNVLYVITAQMPSSGLIAPFGGMLVGWLIGGGSPSPLRRAYLKLRLVQLDAEAKRARGERKKRVERSGLRVVEGTKRGTNGDDEGGSSGPYLN